MSRPRASARLPAADATNAPPAPVALPQFWSAATDASGASVLTHAVRGGGPQALLTALGISALAGALAFAAWLAEGATIAGVVLILVVSGGLGAFGAHCLQRAWLARTEYTFTPQRLRTLDYSLWGSKRREVLRDRVGGVSQQYSPPTPSQPSGHPGSWVTFLDYTAEDGKPALLPFAGMHTPEEARWLGAWLEQWTGKTATRAFGAVDEEAVATDLPDLDRQR